MEKQRYCSYSEYLKKQYGEKVYKLPVNLPISCPNRENGKTGCFFCADQGAGFEARSNTCSVTEQLALNRKLIEKKYNAHKFIAYFQNYTNTWMHPDRFEAYMTEASNFPDIVELSVSTRPDCIKRDYLEILKRIRESTGVHITMELGLQTVNYHTLLQMDRGHGLGAFLAAVLLIQEYGFTVCVHLILNLPYDKMEDVMESASVLSALPIRIVKLHSLYIPKNTKLSSDYENGKITICTYEEYMDRLICFVEHIREDIVMERLFSRIPEQDSIFSNWGKSWWVMMEDFRNRMQERDGFQGKYYKPANETAFWETTGTGW